MSFEATQVIIGGSGVASQLGSEETCPNCQSRIGVGELFCPNCGYQRGSWQAAGKAASQASAELQASAWLLRTGDGQVFPLQAGANVLGRGDVSIQLSDGFISRQHAQVEIRGDNVELRDLGSSNGTFLNGERLAPSTPVQLSAGSTFSLGELEFSLEFNPIAADSTVALNPQAEEKAQDGEQDGVTAKQDGSSETEPLQPAASGWELLPADGPSLVIPLGEVTIGRRSEPNQLVLADGYISGRHCRLEASGDKLLITDLGSTNGSFVNNERLQPDAVRELLPEDRLKLGQLELRVVRHPELGQAATEDVPPQAPGQDDQPEQA